MRNTLLKQYKAAEKKLDSMGNPPKGGWSKKQADERRKLRTLLKTLGTKLGSMNPPDKDFP